MDVLLYSFNTVTPLLLIVVSGFFLKKIKIINDEFLDVANSFCFKFALPLQLFASIKGSPFSETFSLKLVGYICVGIFLVCLMLCLFAPMFIKSRGTCGSFIQGVFRSNFLLLGLPLAISMFGEGNVGSLSMTLPFVIIAFNILAVITLSIFSSDNENKKFDFKNLFITILKNPLISASVIGIIFSATSIQVPVFLDSAVISVGRMATPLALIILGGQFEPKNLKGKLSLCVWASMLRLIFVPLVFIVGGVLLGFRNEELGTIMIVFCAPTAVSSYVMAKSMNNDYILAGQLVVFSTMLSAITIFMWVYILRYFSLI